MNQFIIKIPKGLDFDLLGKDAQSAMTEANVQFSGGALVGSQAIDGYELRLVMCDFDFDGFKYAILELELDWVVIASELVTLNQSAIIPYMISLPVYNYEGEIISVEPVTNLTYKIQTYSGKQWMY